MGKKYAKSRKKNASSEINFDQGHKDDKNCRNVMQKLPKEFYFCL